MWVIGTAGHVDHGKSALVKALSGVDPDRLEIEKQRGMTIELGYASVLLPSMRRCGLIDVPGHSRFINTMVAGASAVCGALVVVAADDGPKPQTLEHIDVLGFIGIRHCVVAVSKIDLTTQHICDEVAEEARALLHARGINSVATVFTSTKTGEGTDKLALALDKLLDVVSVEREQSVTRDTRPRMWIDRAITIPGAGRVVTGTVTGNHFLKDEIIEASPHNGATARIRAIEIFGAPTESALPNGRAALNISGKDLDLFDRGSACIRPESFKPISRIGVRLSASTQNPKPLSEKGAYFFHCGTSRTSVRLKIRSSSVEPGQSELAIISLATALPLRISDRFVIRETGRDATVAGGEILDIDVPLRGTDYARLESIASADDKALHLIERRGVIHSQELMQLVGYLPADTLRFGDWLTSEEWFKDVEQNVVAHLDQFHKLNGLAVGLSLQAVSESLGGSDPTTLAIRELSKSNKVHIEDGIVSLPNRGLSLSTEETVLVTKALKQLAALGASPCSPAEVGITPDLLKALTRKSLVVQVAPTIAYPTQTFEALTKKILELCNTTGGASVSQVRQALNTSRKYAVPLLEELDRRKITQRQGDRRHARKNQSMP